MESLTLYLGEVYKNIINDMIYNFVDNYAPIRDQLEKKNENQYL